MVAATLAFGEIVSWTPPVSVDYGHLKEALSSAGLDAKLLASDMLPRNAFARASHKLEENRIIRQIEETPTHLLFQATREWLDQAEHEMKYSKEAVIRLDKKTGHVECEVAALQSAVQAMLDAEIQVRRAADITRLVQRIFDRHKGDLVSIREAGGAYFVPQGQTEIVDRVQEFMAKVGGKLVRFAIGGGSEETSRSIAESMTEHFSHLVAEFRQSLEIVSPDCSAFVLQRRHARIRELRFKLDTFRDLLSENAEGIGKAIADAERLLEQRRNPDAFQDNEVNSGTADAEEPVQDFLSVQMEEVPGGAEGPVLSF